MNYSLLKTHSSPSLFTNTVFSPELRGRFVLLICVYLLLKYKMVIIVDKKMFDKILSKYKVVKVVSINLHKTLEKKEG